MKSSDDVRLDPEARRSIFASAWRRLRWWHGALALTVVSTAVALPVGCGAEDPIDLGRGTTPTDNCVDGDKDGYGVGCTLGNDCDDADGAVTFECTCDHEAPGCECTEQGKRIACGQVESQVGGQTVCGYGESVCDNGAWSPCIINNTVTLAPSGDGDKQGQVLGGPSACTTNPCDPYCNTFIDDPSGLTDPLSGILETDAGLTLVGDLDIPPAQCTTDPAVSYLSCAHHLCETGGYLVAGCDNPLPPVPVQQTVTIFSETFANNNAGWYATANSSAGVNALAAAEWQIGVSAAASSGSQATFFEDPASDHTATADNGIAGVKVGGLATTSPHSLYHLYSPVINATGGIAGLNGTLSFWRFLNADSRPWQTLNVDVCNGASCQQIWTNPGGFLFPASTKDGGWTPQSLNIPAAYLTANLQIRFSIASAQPPLARAPYAVSSWNIDDLDVQVQKMVAPPPVPGCVASVCAQLPSCCDPFGSGWTYNCTNLVPTVCPGTSCGQVNGFCTVCYQDGVDHDGDGFSFTTGDCADCDPNINPGAYDYPLNTVDEDCNGTPDDEPANCDSGIAGTPDYMLNTFDYVHALDLCRVQTGNSWACSRAPLPHWPASTVGTPATRWSPTIPAPRSSTTSAPATSLRVVRRCCRSRPETRAIERT